MKYLPLVFALLLYSIPQCQTHNFTDITTSTNSFEVLDAAGGDGVGDDGSISFSVGQPFFNTYINTDYSVNEGVQQSFLKDEIKNPSRKEPQIHVMVYPNPVDDFFTIKVEGLEYINITYKLFDFQGKLINGNPLEPLSTMVSAHNLPTGIYLLHILKKDQHIKTLKIIKQ